MELVQVTDNNGVALFPEVPAGSATVHVVAPPKYLPPPDTVVMITEGQEARVDYTLKFRTGALRVLLVDSTGAPVPGADVVVQVT